MLYMKDNKCKDVLRPQFCAQFCPDSTLNGGDIVSNHTIWPHIQMQIVGDSQIARFLSDLCTRNEHRLHQHL